MKHIIQEIEEVIREKFSEGLQKLFIKVRDISEFIIATKGLITRIRKPENTAIFQAN